MHSERNDPPNLLRAVLTDIQFWIPVAVLAVGVALLIFVHDK
jgi:hypothetical protein